MTKSTSVVARGWNERGQAGERKKGTLRIIVVVLVYKFVTTCPTVCLKWYFLFYVNYISIKKFNYPAGLWNQKIKSSKAGSLSSFPQTPIPSNKPHAKVHAISSTFSFPFLSTSHFHLVEDFLFPWSNTIRTKQRDVSFYDTHRICLLLNSAHVKDTL